MHPFSASTFAQKFLTGNCYMSLAAKVGFFSRCFPSLAFYSRLFTGPLPWLCRRAARGLCDDAAWVYASVWVAEIMERAGCPIEIQGMDAINATDGPCLFVANHMSTLETFMLPGIIRPRRPVTFVVKESLVTMPFFGAVMRSRDPIVVGRRNPRADLQAVLQGGLARLQKGISIIIFPQSTRSRVFDAHHFNTIGVKLARKANVPIVPLALKTDAWGQGKPIKDFGPIKSGLAVRYQFAQPMRVTGQGKEEHAAICQFIAGQLARWEKQDQARPAT